MTGAVCFEDIGRATRRIHGHVRRTPAIEPGARVCGAGLEGLATP